MNTITPKELKQWQEERDRLLYKYSEICDIETATERQIVDYMAQDQ